jgi:ABC-type transport system substrate-binding protein
MRSGNFDVVLEAPDHGLVNPLLDVQKFLPESVDAENYAHYQDDKEVALYQQMLHETDPAKQRVLMRRLEKYLLDDQAHEIWLLWWYRIVPYRSYVKGFKIAPTHSSIRTWRGFGWINQSEMRFRRPRKRGGPRPMKRRLLGSRSHGNDEEK